MPKRKLPSKALTAPLWVVVASWGTKPAPWRHAPPAPVAPAGVPAGAAAAGGWGREGWGGSRGGGVGRGGPGGETGGLAGELRALARARVTWVEERGAPNLAGAEHARSGGEANGAATVSLAQCGDFGGGFDFAFGKQRAVGDREIEAELETFFVNRGRGILGPGSRRLAPLGGEDEHDVGGAGLGLGPDLAGFGEVGLEREDAIESGVAADATKLQRAHDRIVLPVRGQSHKRIRHGDATKVERIGATLGVGVEQGRRGGRER